MPNILLRKVVVSETPTPLGGNEVFSVDIQCPPTNTAPVFFRVGPDGDEVEWVPSEYHFMPRIRLGDLWVRGVEGDIVTLVGGTWL